ncbi:MAG: amidase [Gammaproteobacteria bacterium]|nr:amidase [Gammaproteobacteria bacterium]
MSDLIWESAVSLAARLRAKQVSAVEVLNAFYTQIERMNPGLNALVNLLDPADARRLAVKADESLARGDEVGPLHGLPMAPKDLIDARGFPTTSGFVPFADRVASRDCALVSRQRRAGAILIGKSNVPEFGLGSHTFNSLFGTTRNPYDLDKTAGGSSGGAAVALASGMLPIADGSDMGGSLRNPASFCNVVGLRPSAGRVPYERDFGWFARLSTSGPMAKTVADAALLLSAQAGPFPADPLTLDVPGSDFRKPLEGDLSGVRLAWSPNLDLVPVDGRVTSVLEKSLPVFEQLGCTVAGACPELSEAMAVFQVQRAAGLAVLGDTLDRTEPGWRSHAKDTLMWNIEKGLALSARELLASEMIRTKIYHQLENFFADFDALLLPAAQVPPFPAEQDWVREINGQPMETYIDWMTICCAISVTGLPAISVPAGFTDEGLPIGLQIVGKPRGDFELLQLAHGFEQATEHYRRKPDLSTTPV